MDAQAQARQTVQGLRKAKEQVQGVTRQATLMKAIAKSQDGGELLRCANEQLAKLITLRSGVQSLDPGIKTLSRMLSSKPPSTGGMSPAAQWGPELRAASKQFFEALTEAERS
jgi:hypothetical protein